MLRQAAGGAESHRAINGPASNLKTANKTGHHLFDIREDEAGKPHYARGWDENDLSLSWYGPSGYGNSLIMAMERATRQRDAIKSVIQEAKRPLSPREVLAGARGTVRALGLATVYRNLKRLVAEGTVQVITLPGESSRYEMGKSAHHHHFQCTTCRRVYDVPGCPGNLRRMAPRGFRVEHHDVTLYGRCSDCGKRELRAVR